MILPFELLLEGEFAKEAVFVSWSAEGMAKTADTERMINDHWAAANREAENSGQILFSGKLCRLNACKSEGSHAEFEFGPTNYKELVGTNLTYPEIGNKLGPDYLSNGSGVCSVVVTSDDQILLQLRNSRVHEFPGHYHVCGGNIEPQTRGQEVYADPFLSIQSELEEEISVQPADVISMFCLGAARDVRTLKPEILFKTKIRTPSGHFGRGEGVEHRKLIFLAVHPDVIANFIVTNFNLFVPVGLACLVAYCKIEYGEQWYKDLVFRVTSTDRN